MYYTPLRYPGGKGKFAPFIKSVIDLNNLHNGHYLEIYAGGAAVALDLLISGYCKHIHINDIDKAIYNFWQAITRNTEDFLKLIIDTTISMDEWHKQKYILEHCDQFSSFEHGFATFFLNRTNRSGILKGGVIGGKNQSGNYLLDARFNKVDLIKRIERIGIISDNISVYNEDAYDLLNRVKEVLPKKSLIYLDPPYYIKGKGLYRNFYSHEDHVLIKNTLKSIKYPWITSYDNTDEIKAIYSDYQQTIYYLNYSAQNKVKSSELVINPKNVKIPVNDKIFL